METDERPQNAKTVGTSTLLGCCLMATLKRMMRSPILWGAITSGIFWAIWKHKFPWGSLSMITVYFEISIFRDYLKHRKQPNEKS